MPCQTSTAECTWADRLKRKKLDVVMFKKILISLSGMTNDITISGEFVQVLSHSKRGAYISWTI